MLRILSFSREGVGVDAFVALTSSNACWNDVAMFWNVGCSIVILVAFVSQEVLYMSCNCWRAWNISCWASISRFAGGFAVGEAAMVLW